MKRSKYEFLPTTTCEGKSIRYKYKTQTIRLLEVKEKNIIEFLTHKR